MNDRFHEEVSDSKKEACKTYVEQTKLLVTLASAFLFAPAALIGILKDRAAVGLTGSQFWWFIAAEVLFIWSVLAGYIVLGTLTGSQDAGEFNVYRPATRWSSLIQFGTYLFGLIVFIALALSFATQPYSPPNPAFKTWNNCPPNFTVQDGLCKPYTGG